MSRRFLAVLLTAVFLATPAIADSIGIGSIGRGGANKPVVGTTGRTSVHAKTEKQPHHGSAIADHESPRPQDR